MTARQPPQKGSERSKTTRSHPRRVTRACRRADDRAGATRSDEAGRAEAACAPSAGPNVWRAAGNNARLSARNGADGLRQALVTQRGRRLRLLRCRRQRIDERSGRSLPHRLPRLRARRGKPYQDQGGNHDRHTVGATHALRIPHSRGPPCCKTAEAGLLRRSLPSPTTRGVGKDSALAKSTTTGLVRRYITVEPREEHEQMTRRTPA